MFTNLSDRMNTVLQAVFVLILVGVAAAILLSMGVLQNSSGSHLVTFQVKASGGFAVITLKAGSESISTPETVTSPWSKTMRIPKGTEIYLTAANPSQTGEISCRIMLDGKDWKLEKSNAPKNGVACAGIVP